GACFPAPPTQSARRARRLDRRRRELGPAVGQAGRVESAAIRLAAVDPRRVLARGYALLSDPGGHPVTSVAQIAAGDALVAVLRDGQAEVDVRSIAPAAAPP
ncbi:MAG: exodeoxyribonuclease VII large subunit, partial [Caldimonas sp.]